MSESPDNVSDFNSEWTDNVEYNLFEFHNVDPSAAEMAASIFHLKLELLTQFSALNAVNRLYLWKIGISNVKLLD